MSEVKEFVSFLASHKVSLELDVSNFDLDATKSFRSGQTIDFVNGVTGYEVVSEAVVPVLTVVSKGKLFFIWRFEAQLIRNLHVCIVFNQVAVRVLVSDVADG